MSRDLFPTLSLQGLVAAPPQILGGVRLVPLLRPRVRDDLRLTLRRYDDDATVVALGGKHAADHDANRALRDGGVKYISYVPHGLILDWTDDGSAAAHGTQLFDTRRVDGRRFAAGPHTLRVAHRMVKREETSRAESGRLRMLPLHLAMEGFLSLAFSGPDTAFGDYSDHALRRGLDPRAETVYGGRAIRSLEDALSLFEIHEGQTGVMVFVQEALASIFVVPHPDDYRALHRSLIEDFYGELIVHYGWLPAPLGAEHHGALDLAQVTSLSSLREQHQRARDAWSAAQESLVNGVVGRPTTSEKVYQAGPFTLARFLTSLDLSSENHLGEAIVRDDGEVAYLKTYRLSHAQAKRAFLLQQLKRHGWDLHKAARAMGTTRAQLVLRVVDAGFARLFTPEAVARAVQQARRELSGERERARDYLGHPVDAAALRFRDGLTGVEQDEHPDLVDAHLFHHRAPDGALAFELAGFYVLERDQTGLLLLDVRAPPGAVWHAAAGSGALTLRHDTLADLQALRAALEEHEVLGGDEGPEALRARYRARGAATTTRPGPTTPELAARNQWLGCLFSQPHTGRDGLSEPALVAQAAACFPRDLAARFAVESALLNDDASLAVSWLLSAVALGDDDLLAAVRKACARSTAPLVQAFVQRFARVDVPLPVLPQLTARRETFRRARAP